MPSWSSLLSLSSKQSPSSSSSSSSSSHSTNTLSTSPSSTTSTPLVTPNSSSVSLATPPNGNSKRRERRRLRKLEKRQQLAQPQPIRPRLTSLFFPTSTLTAEQEERCVYKASSYAASCSDLLGGSGGGRPVSGLRCKHGNFSSLDLSTIPSVTSTPYSTSISAYSQSVGNLNRFDGALGLDLHTQTEDENPYLSLAPRYPTNRRVQRKSVDYTSMMTRMERSKSTSGGAGIQRGAEIWSSPYESDTDLSSARMAPPPVPARSNLRPTASASNLRDRFSKASTSTPFTLPVDPLPLTATPALLYPSTFAPPSSALPPITPPPLVSSPSTESAFSIGRRRRPNIPVRGGSISGDPARVRDGVLGKDSSSGVYTPPTFPGAQAQSAKPTQSQSRVYTPSSFVLASPSAIRSFVPPPPSPSRSTSVSSTSTTSSFGEVTTPRTPQTPLTSSSRFLGAVSGGWGSAVTGIKRASATLSTRSLSSPSASSSHAYTPTSARDGFFPSTIYETAQTGANAAGGTPLAPSFWPTTPGSAAATKPYGLGLGIGGGTEDAGYQRSRSESSGTLSGEKFGGVLVGDVPKGKRKPVPKAVGSEEIREEDEAEVEVVHAL